MPKLTTLISTTVLAAGTVYGGIKGYIYFNAKSEVDNLVNMAGLFADVRYDGISSSMNGTLSVDDISITPHGSADTIRIGSLEVKGPGIGFLLDMSGGLKKGEPPSQLALSAKGITVPVGSDLLQQFTRSMGGPGGARLAYQPEPCSLAGVFRPTDMAILGFEDLVMNLGVSYEISKATQEIFFKMDYSLEDIEAVELEMELKGVSEPAAMMMGAMPVIDDLSVRYSTDAEFMSKALSYCADSKNQPVQAFLDDMFNQDDRYYKKAIGFVPGTGIRNALKKYMANPNEIVIDFKPTGNVNPAMFAFYDPKDAVAMLGMKVHVNGERIEDLSFSVPEATEGYESNSDFLASLGIRGGSSSSSGSGSKAGAYAQKKRRPKTVSKFVLTAISDLDKHVGKEVRLYTSDEAKPKQGVLVSLKYGEANVEQRIYNGKMTSHIPLSLVQKAEVLLRVSTKKVSTR